MVSLSNHEGVARTKVRIASWFDPVNAKHSPVLTMKLFCGLYASHPFISSPAMIRRRISLVPAPISSSLVARYRRLISVSRM